MGLGLYFTLPHLYTLCKTKLNAFLFDSTEDFLSLLGSLQCSWTGLDAHYTLG